MILQDYTEEKLLLAVTSNVKVEPTLQSAKNIFGNVNLQTVKATSNVSENPYAFTETLRGAYNRWWTADSSDLSDAVYQTVAIESGVFPTYSIPDYEYFIIRLPGKFNINKIALEEQVTSADLILSVNPLNNLHKEIALAVTPANNLDKTIQANDPKARYLDRAIIITYDKITEHTYLGVSRGVEFPFSAVYDAIYVNKGKERVSESMRLMFIKECLINEQDIILQGPLQGQKFNVQDPQSFITMGKFPRIVQLAEIITATFLAVKTTRKTTSQT